MLYVGTDIEEVCRFSNLLERKPQILQKMFFLGEWNYSRTKANQAVTLCGIWCAKEAVVKALAPALKLEILDVEILYSKVGFPYAVINSEKMHELGISISISIAHTLNYATAVALCQK